MSLRPRTVRELADAAVIKDFSAVNISVHSWLTQAQEWLDELSLNPSRNSEIY
jgi:hypothetical protein